MYMQIDWLKFRMVKQYQTAASSKCSCSGMYQWFDCHLLGHGWFHRVFTSQNGFPSQTRQSATLKKVKYETKTVTKLHQNCILPRVLLSRFYPNLGQVNSYADKFYRLQTTLIL